jgi:acyl-CoA thioesterase YciA
MDEPNLFDEGDPSRWRLAIRVLAMPADTNAAGDIFGGWLMSQADIAGATVAVQAAAGRVVTVAVNEFRFVSPVAMGDLVDLYARVERIGTTSVRVEIRAWARRELDPESRHHVAFANITYVAVGADGRPRPIAESSKTI